MYWIHRLGHIEAKSLELVMSDISVRQAKQAYSYMSLGFAAQIEAEVGIAVEGIRSMRSLSMNNENCTQRVLIT